MKHARELVIDFIGFTGFVLVVYGVSLISFPAAVITAGIICAGFAVAVSIPKKDSD